MKSPLWWRRLKARFTRRLKLVTVNDQQAVKARRGELVLAREDGEDWSVHLRCPCGCGKPLELLLIPEAKPHWGLAKDERGRPNLCPSVWLRTGCRSHFWVRGGNIDWCD